jgi:hypothetical protein
MSQTQSNISQYFSEAFVCFEHENSKLEKLPFKSSKFGILNLTTVPYPPPNVEHDFVFVVDRSGSMSDSCSDGRSKMQHIIHTLKNMIIYFNETADLKAHDIKINITIFAFDDNFVRVIERTQITEENLNSILAKIDKIRPNDCTNIELALKETNKYILELQQLYPENQVNHIFMTDGEATMGDTNPHNLRKLVNKNIYNSFVGFGLEHDANLLDIISSVNKSNYYFIDAIERAGLVYGEILHTLIYKLLYDVEISIENGLIYNYASNLWTDKLYIGDVTGETNKIYHTLIEVDEESEISRKCYVQVDYKIHETNETINSLHIYQKEVDKDSESYFARYNFRQRTMELLYEAKQIQQKKYNQDEANIFNKSNNQINKDQIKEIKQRMDGLFNEMKQYIKDISDDISDNKKFIKNLCDDIYITRKTFGSTYGIMFSCARQTSQGTQRCYTVNTTPTTRLTHNTSFASTSFAFDIDADEGNLSPTKLRRQSNSSSSDSLQMFKLDEEITPMNEDDYVVSNFEDTPYLTPTATHLMRTINTQEGDNDFYISDDNEEKSVDYSLTP